MTPWEWNEVDLRYLYLELGWTAKAISEEWSIPYVTLNRKLRRMGINRGRGKFERGVRVDDPVLVANVAQRYVEADMTMAEIEADIGLGRHAVSGVLKRAGVPIRTPANCGGVRRQDGEHNNNWQGGPGVRPCDARRSSGS